MPNLPEFRLGPNRNLEDYNRLLCLARKELTRSMKPVAKKTTMSTRNPKRVSSSRDAENVTKSSPKKKAPLKKKAASPTAPGHPPLPQSFLRDLERTHMKTLLNKHDVQTRSVQFFMGIA